MHTAARRTLALSILVAASCGGATPTPGEAVRPDEQTATEALGETTEVKACSKPGYAEPLVVDLKSSERTDLEIAMKDGVAVAAYDCRSLKVLKGCKAKGEYKFVGVGVKEESLQLTSKDEVAANLPISGASLSGELGRDAALDLAIVTVGKSRVAVTKLDKGGLEGDCDGATHLVRGAYVGAFAMDQGTKGKVRAAAAMFGASANAGSDASKRTRAKDGDVEACKKADSKAESAPSGCASVLRVELVPLGEAPPLPFAKGSHACAEGLVWQGDKCGAPAGTTREVCFEQLDRTACASRCADGRGDDDACVYLAVAEWAGATDPIGDGEGDPPSKAEEDAALKARAKRIEESAKKLEPTFQKYCDKNSARACYFLGEVHGERAIAGGTPKATVKAARAKASAAYEKACDQGDAFACGQAAITADDPARALIAAERGCALGDSGACRIAAEQYEQGRGAKKDLEKAKARYQRACDASHDLECLPVKKISKKS